MSHILPLQLPITKFNKKTEQLILGFVRRIEITNWIIPSVVLELCIMYYHSKRIVICFTESIKIVDLDANKVYNTTITPLKQSANPLQFINGPVIDELYFRVCYVEEFSLPSRVFKQNTALDSNNVYSVIFELIDQTRSYYAVHPGESAHAYIVDANADEKYKIYEEEYIDIYHWPIPSPKHSQLYPLYSEKHGLIAIGQEFARLTFDDPEIPECKPWNWETMDGKYTIRQEGAAVFIGEDRLIYCGGGSYFNTERKCEVYDFNTCNWSSLNSMNIGRKRCGICFDGVTDKVFVGGGIAEELSSLTSFEYLDLKQNKWISLCSANDCHSYCPIIWIDDAHAQVIHIASSSSQVFERMDLRENKWNIYIDKEKYQNMFGKNSIMFSKLCM
eukprot:530749_1